MPHALPNQKDLLDRAITLHCLSVVGRGYIDIIVHRKKLDDFVAELNVLDIQVEAATWWCLADEDGNNGCPHGLGGPSFRDTFLSEIAEEYDNFQDFRGGVWERNQQALEKIRSKLTQNGLIYASSECLHVGLWLEVPKPWRNIFVRNRYLLQLMFEWGGGAIWAGNDSAMDDFPVGPLEDRLNLSSHILKKIGQMTEWHDKSLNWEYPPDPGPWPKEEYDKFDAEVAILMRELQYELGLEFEIRYDQLGYFEK